MIQEPNLLRGPRGYGNVRGMRNWADRRGWYGMYVMVLKALPSKRLAQASYRPEVRTQVG